MREAPDSTSNFDWDGRRGTLIGRLLLAGIGVLVLTLAGVLGVAMRRGVGQPPLGSVSAGFTSAAPFELKRFDGGTVSLATFEDRPVFLYFWASWCTPCRSEAPVIQRLWPEYEALGYAFLGVNILDQEADAQRFIQEFGLTFPLVRDAEGTVYLEYGVYGMPESFFLKPGLVVQEKYLGELSEPILRERLAKAAEGGPPKTEVVQ